MSPTQPTQTTEATVVNISRLHDVLEEIENLDDPNMDPGRWLHLYHQLSGVLLQGVPGDVVELGCHKGNTSVFIQKILVGFGSSKTLHVFDSFQGLPAWAPEDENTAAFLQPGVLAATADDVLQTFATRGAHPPVIHPGWFQNTLPTQLPAPISFAHLDGDFYESIRVSLEYVYPRLAAGGVAVIDDYLWKGTPGARLACNEFFADKAETVQTLRGTTQAVVCKLANDEGSGSRKQRHAA